MPRLSPDLLYGERSRPEHNLRAQAAATREREQREAWLVRTTDLLGRFAARRLRSQRERCQLGDSSAFDGYNLWPLHRAVGLANNATGVTYRIYGILGQKLPRSDFEFIIYEIGTPEDVFSSHPTEFRWLYQGRDLLEAVEVAEGAWRERSVKVGAGIGARPGMDAEALLNGLQRLIS